jgi:hypothetical protein
MKLPHTLTGAICNCPAAQALRTIWTYALPAAPANDEELSKRNCKKLLNLETRTFHRHAPHVPGAYKVGKTWFCSKSAWVAYHAAKTGAGSADDDAYAVAVRKAGAR